MTFAIELQPKKPAFRMFHIARLSRGSYYIEPYGHPSRKIIERALSAVRKENPATVYVILDYGQLELLGYYKDGKSPFAKGGDEE